MQRQLRSSNVNLPSVWNLDQHQANADAFVAAMANDDDTAPAAIAAPVVIWKTNPLHGDFNPGTLAGSKIFLQKIEGLPISERLPFTKSKAAEIFQHFKAREANLGSIIRSVPYEFNQDGSVKSTANILTQYQLLSLQDVQRAAFGRFGEPIAPGDPIPEPPFQLKELDPASNDEHKKLFYRRVDSNVVVANIQNCLTPSGYEDLLLQKDKFTFSNASGELEYDSAVMLLLICQKLDPSTVVGYDMLIEELRSMKLGDYNNDVDKMLTAMEQKYAYLKSNYHAPENFRKMVFSALLSGPNANYNDFIQRIKDDVESGIGANRNIDADSLIAAGRTKYTNMESQKLWNKVDPRDAQIMALTTKLKAFEDERRKPAPSVHATDRKDSKQKPADSDLVEGTQVEVWRTIKVGEKKTDEKGKVWTWCPHHKFAGKWDGLYVRHESADCPKKKTRQNKNSNSGGGGNGGTTPATDNKSASLDLQTKLKNVMCTNLCMSSEDVDKLFEQAKSEN